VTYLKDLIRKKDLDKVELKESELYKNIGQLQVENQFLKKSTKRFTEKILTSGTITQAAYHKKTVCATWYPKGLILLQSKRNR